MSIDNDPYLNYSAYRRPEIKLKPITLTVIVIRVLYGCSGCRDLLP